MHQNGRLPGLQRMGERWTVSTSHASSTDKANPAEARGVAKNNDEALISWWMWLLLAVLVLSILYG
ncbi:MAG: hypothetical protein FWF12_08305 [Betaproteobacteria bacterium]|nr:hypothetical protein [Betaproteobacteria bacterium]